MLPIATSTVIQFLKETMDSSILGYLDLLKAMLGYIVLIALITLIVRKLMQLRPH